MKTVTLKADENFYDRLDRLAKHLHLSKSEVIRRSVTVYEAAIERERIRKRFKEASLKVRGANDEIIRDFEAAVADGLDD